MADARGRKFDCIMVWKLDRFGRSLVDCLNNIGTLEDHGVRFIAVTQGLDTDHRNPASRFLLHVLGAAAEFERSLIRKRSHAELRRYRQDFTAGKVGKETHSRSGKDLPIGRSRRVFDRHRITELRQMGLSPRQFALQMGLGEGTVRRLISGLREMSAVPGIESSNRSDGHSAS
jgi:putative DNA-invertase from lambdoid prophage Rac